MTSTSPPADEQPWEKARRLLGYGVSEAVKMAREEGIEESAIQAAAVDVAALLTKFSEGKASPSPAPAVPRLRVVYPPAFQLCLLLEPAWKPTPRQARRSRSRPMVRTCRSCERTWTQQELFPVPAEIAALVAALAARFTTW